MTVSATVASRALAFGSVEEAVWGTAWISADPPTVRIAVGAAGTTDVLEATVTDDALDAPWRLSGEHCELVLTPHRPDGPDQICDAKGTFVLAGREHPVRCLGWRTLTPAGVLAAGVESFRVLAAWFAPGRGFSVLAIRPRRARGHQADAITAHVLDPEATLSVADPRLSTTYSGRDRPSRAGVELWIGETDDQQYPRRGAGEAIGEAAVWTADGLDLCGQLFRWHAEDANGAGVYLLGTVR